MGVFNDEYLIFIALKSEPLEFLRKEIISTIYSTAEEWEEFIPYGRLSNYIPPISHTLSNDLYVLFWPMDGSKEGWSTSSIVDEARAYIIHKYLDKWNYDSHSFADKIRYIYLEDSEFYGLNVEDRYSKDT